MLLIKLFRMNKEGILICHKFLFSSPRWALLNYQTVCSFNLPKGQENWIHYYDKASDTNYFDNLNF